DGRDCAGATLVASAFARKRAPTAYPSWRAGSRRAGRTVLAIAAARTAMAAATLGTRALGFAARTRTGRAWSARARAARAGCGGAVAGRSVVGREAHRAARMPVGMRGLGAALSAAGAALLARARPAARTRLARAAAVGVAVSGRTGVDAVGHVPGAERRRIAIRQRLGALGLALLERLLRLLGRLFAAHRQPAMRLLAAASATVLAHVVEAAQLATFVGGVVAVDVALRTTVAAHVHGRLRRLALADHRQQGQRRRRAFLQLELLAQGLDLGVGQLLRLPAQQRLRQRHLAVADALEATDLAALRLPQATHLAVAALLEQHLEPFVRIGAADALDLVELRRPVLQRHAAGEAVDDLLRHRLLALGRAHPGHVLAFDLVGRMHHRVGQLAVGGEQQQAGGVDVEAADRDPARALERGQGFEDRRAALGILARGHFAFGLVV